jgi:hypothetical protein
MRSCLLSAVVVVTALAAGSEPAGSQDSPNPWPIFELRNTLARTYFRTPTQPTDMPYRGGGQGVGAPWQDLTPPFAVACPPPAVSCTAHVTVSFSTGLPPFESAFEYSAYLSIRAFVDHPSNLAWPHEPFFVDISDWGEGVHLKTRYDKERPEYDHYTLQFVKTGLGPGTHTVAVQAKRFDEGYDEDATPVRLNQKVIKVEMYSFGGFDLVTLRRGDTNPDHSNER